MAETSSASASPRQLPEGEGDEPAAARRRAVHAPIADRSSYDHWQAVGKDELAMA